MCIRDSVVTATSTNAELIELGTVCLEAFDEFVGIAYSDSRFFVDLIIPDQETWDSGFNTASCYIFDAAGLAWEGDLEGSAL